MASFNGTLTGSQSFFGDPTKPETHSLALVEDSSPLITYSPAGVWSDSPLADMWSSWGKYITIEDVSGDELGRERLRRRFEQFVAVVPQLCRSLSEPPTSMHRRYT